MKVNFADILSELRRERNLSQRRVAGDLGISQALLSHYENGLREPRLEFVARVCDYYDVSADYILGRSKRNPSSDAAETFIEELRALTDRAEKTLCGKKGTP